MNSLGKKIGRALVLSGALATVVLAYSSTGSVPSEEAPFPRDFLWGVANSAFQVEGNPGDSDWSRFTRRPGAIRDGTNADVATDFWNRYEEDFALANKIGLNAFRISIAWERIAPRDGEWDAGALAHYRKIISAMRKYGLEPIVTLQHFALPGWLVDEGGLLSPRFAEVFAEYARYVIPALSEGSEGVRIWLTMNEPELMAFLGYNVGVWPPALAKSRRGSEALLALARGHVAAVRAVRSLVPPETKFGIAKNWMVFTPIRRNGIDSLAANIVNRYGNLAFLDALLTGQANFRFLDGDTYRGRLNIPKGFRALDFIGLNYYTRNQVGIVPRPPFYASRFGPGMKSDLGWEIYPEGIESAIRQAHAKFKLPILISENGIADADDSRRAEFVKDHLQKLRKLNSERIPLLGYLHWSLTDNFEWADGLTPRFGLVGIDYATGARFPRPSYRAYGDEVVRERAKSRER